MQAVLKQQRQFHDKKTDKEIPDIAGNLGYPNRYEPSYEQTKRDNKLVA
jgi:hypothetical protein